jgi:mRNA interferase RelE/StbE
MMYEIVLKPRAVKDLARLSPADQNRIVMKLEMLTDDLQGDVKKLTGFTPEYRLRIGDWRALLEAEAGKVVVYRILHRSKAYK